MLEILFLFGAGLIAGAINSLAGGGSFIAFPALLLAGVPPVMANATNTFAAWPGYVSGAIGYWSQIKENRHRLPPYIAAAIIGGFLGAELLLRVNDEQFSTVVPWLMGLAVFMFAFGGNLSKWMSAQNSAYGSKAKIIAVSLWLLLALICLYGGFFNAGLGIILLAFFALAGISNIHAMNGVKLLLSAIVSSVAIIRFTMEGSIAWYEGSFVFAGSMVGGFVSAKLAKFIPTPVLRNGIIVYGIVLTLVFFWQAYGT
ncbi:MAG: sulfite exporter TauE/SafE family protein [Devosiaceae bacterium]|nr:sulfite exporter TauE/SafE family protein [Devosiaceae bacterium]